MEYNLTPLKSFMNYPIVVNSRFRKIILYKCSCGINHYGLYIDKCAVCKVMKEVEEAIYEY